MREESELGLSFQLVIMIVLTFSYIQIEEIAVQDSLNDTSKDGNQVVVAFTHISVDLENHENVVICIRVFVVKLSLLTQLRI